MTTKTTLAIGAAFAFACTQAFSQPVEDMAKAESIIASPERPDRSPDEKGLEITAEKEASFDSSAKRAVFSGSVIVKDPRFELRCDNLTVELNPDGEGGLRRAKADGNVVIVQMDATPGTNEVRRSTGRSDSAIYEPATGNIILLGWPQVQQGINLHRATVASTRMTLNKNGRMQTEGPSMTIIVDKENPQ